MSCHAMPRHCILTATACGVAHCILNYGIIEQYARLIKMLKREIEKKKRYRERGKEKEEKKLDEREKQKEKKR